MKMKIIAVVFSLCLSLSICAEAENTNRQNDQNIPGNAQQMPPGGGFGRGGAPEGMAPPSGEMPENMPGGEAAEPVTETEPAQDTAGQNQEDTGNEMVPSVNDGEMMKGGFPGNMQNSTQTAQEEEKGFLETYSTPVTAIILLVFAFVFVIFYKRRNY